MALPFDPSRCDLCGSTDDEVLVHVPTGRAMRSDLGSVAVSLEKRACLRCGLVRSGGTRGDLGLDTYYEEQYTVGLQQEHRFYSAQGPLPRSAVFADWFLEAAPEGAWRRGQRILEIGAGSGRLLGELARRFPESEFVGFEPHRGAAARARANGLAVHDSWSQVGTAYDLAYSVAVVEHVASPTAFLGDIATRLRPEAKLLLSQPIQDVPSYDVFFVDHLHHFGSAHLRAYALKCGFEEERATIGHPLMPNFSLHLWRREDTPRAEAESAWRGPRASTTCAETANRVLRDMARVDALLVRVRPRRPAGRRLRPPRGLLARPLLLHGRRLPVRLRSRRRAGSPGVCRPRVSGPRPEDCTSKGVEDVILAMNALYYPAVRERLGRLGLAAHPVLGEV